MHFVCRDGLVPLAPEGPPRLIPGPGTLDPLGLFIPLGWRGLLIPQQTERRPADQEIHHIQTAAEKTGPWVSNS